MKGTGGGKVKFTGRFGTQFCGKDLKVCDDGKLIQLLNFGH
jgi:hypothetical protein